MAIEEHDREDLLRDGRMMPVRGEAILDDVTVLIGFRSQGQLSLYFGSEQVFQFDQSQSLRRVYLHGRRYAAQQGQLIELVRQSRGGRVELIRREIGDEQLQCVLDATAACLDKLRVLDGPGELRWRVIGADESEFAAEVSRWLAAAQVPLRIGAAPGA
jgi:hypothetical protein